MGVEDFNLLVAIPSPRDILEFRESVAECLKEQDKLWLKHCPISRNPYSLIRDYFTRHKTKYTHLAILPDDLMINRHGVNQLIDNVVSNPKKYQVMMGTCAVEWNSKEVALTKNLPSLRRSERRYDWFSRRELKGKGIIKVPYCGTPFAIISAKVVEQISLGNDLKWNSDNVGYAHDVLLSHELAGLGIPIWVDTSVYFLHLKGKPGIQTV